MQQNVRLQEPVQALKDFVAGLDPETLDPAFALQLVKVFSEGEKVCAAGKALAASRVASSGAWQRDGDRSAAHFISRTTGDSVGNSVLAIETARRMQELPQTNNAYRSGKLTSAQAAEIASAAAVAPEAENELLKVAETEGIAKLRQVSRTVMAAKTTDEAEWANRLHQQRYLRTWTDEQGIFRLDARLAPEAGAQVRSVLDILRDQQFEQSRRAGQKEPYQALEADALVEMARLAQKGRGDAAGPSAIVNIRVDHTALVRGHTKPKEVCEIPGIGAIPVATARAMMSDAILKLLLVKGGQVEVVTHATRTITSRQRTALIDRDAECVIEGCRETKGLEIDHVVGLAENGKTSLDNLVRLCRHHHRLKTRVEVWSSKASPRQPSLTLLRSNGSYSGPPFEAQAAGSKLALTCSKSAG